jgi:hypothetical protein
VLQAIRRRVAGLFTAVLYGPHTRRGLTSAVDAAIPWAQVLAFAADLARQLPAHRSFADELVLPADVSAPLDALMQALVARGLEEAAQRIDALVREQLSSHTMPATPVLPASKSSFAGSEKSTGSRTVEGSARAGSSNSDITHLLRPSSLLAKGAGNGATSTLPQPPLRSSHLHVSHTLDDRSSTTSRIQNSSVGSSAIYGTEPSAAVYYSGGSGVHSSGWAGESDPTASHSESGPLDSQKRWQERWHHQGGTEYADKLTPSLPPGSHGGSGHGSGGLSGHRSGGHLAPSSSSAAYYAQGGRGDDGDAEYDEWFMQDVPHPSGRINDPSRNVMFKTQLCKHWQKYGWCKFGAACGFAHGVTELRAASSAIPTQ